MQALLEAATAMEAERAEEGPRKRVRPDEPDPLAQSQHPDPSPSRLSDPHDSRGPVTPKRVACTHCRQSKLRCDSPKDPCSRCERLGLTCTKDTGYKRVSKKSKIDELEKNVQELRSALDHARPPTTVIQDARIAPLPSIAYQLAPSQASTFNSPLESTNLGASSYIPLADTPLTISQESPQPPAQLSFTPPYMALGRVGSRPRAVKVRAIESTALGKEQIDCLFQIYFDNFHPFFPVLPFAKSPDKYYESCPFLFWIIIAVASRRYSEDMSLLPSLAVAVPKLAWERIADTPQPYTVIQALLIFCMWPFPSTHMWSDVSTIFSNIALNAAFHMGLHRPDHASEFARNPRSSKPYVITSRDPVERRKTWAATNIVSQYTSTSVGYPSTGCCFDWSVDRACEVGNTHTLMDDLRYHLIIQRFSYRTTKLMSGNVSDPLGLPPENQHNLIMKVLEYDLGVLEGQIWSKLSHIDRLYFLGAKMQLEIYHWLGPSSPERNIGIIKSYAVASSLINEILVIDAAFKVLSYGPIFYPRVMFTAAYLIFKVLNSVLSQHVDCEAGASLFHTAVAAIRRYSVEENDVSIRGANILADVWYRRSENIADKSHEPVLVTRSRLGASLMFDCLWRWREQYLKTESMANANPGPTGWHKRQNDGAEPTPPPIDPISLPFDWDLFDDLSWSWNFDIPPIPES